MTVDEKNKEPKEKFLAYYAVLPIQKLGAEHIGVHEDTITDWKKADKEFSDQMGLLKSEWAIKTSARVRNPEWLLERIMKDHFSPRNELTGKEGEALEGLVIIKSANGSSPK